MNEKIKLIASNWINERLEKGKEEYNDELDVHDGRDWIKEAKEELTDAVVYMAAFELQNKNLFQMVNELTNANNGLKEDIIVLKETVKQANARSKSDETLSNINALQDEMETLESVVDDVMCSLNILVDGKNSK